MNKIYRLAEIDYYGFPNYRLSRSIRKRNTFLISNIKNFNYKIVNGIIRTRRLTVYFKEGDLINGGKESLQ